METVEYVILYPTTSPVVRERLMDVLAAAAFTFHGPGKEGFQSTWRRVRPPTKPEDGIPFDKDDAMFDQTQGHRSQAITSPVPPVRCVNAPPSRAGTLNKRTNSKHEDSGHHDRGDWNGNRRDRGVSHSRRQTDHDPISSEVYMQRLFGECEIALGRTRLLKDALANAVPDSLHSNPIIKV